MGFVSLRCGQASALVAPMLLVWESAAPASDSQGSLEGAEATADEVVTVEIAFARAYRKRA